jgi:hypothetical protein
MHAETLAYILTKPLYLPNMKYHATESSCHGNTIILLRIFLKLKNPLKILLLIAKLSISQTYIC